MINIIACDDDADIVRALKIYLSSEGYNVFEAHNGKDVLRLLAENDVQLVLMDVMMPQMDGIETTAEIRKKYNVPVILITAKSEDYDNFTPTEYSILKLFMENLDCVLSPKEIYEKVWHDGVFGSESTVIVHIRHIREKIEIDPADPHYIVAVWGHGYKMQGRGH